MRTIPFWRYDTNDDSRNKLGIALITMGEGWHNNHHRYSGAANQGFFWWEGCACDDTGPGAAAAIYRH